MRFWRGKFLPNAIPHKTRVLHTRAGQQTGVDKTGNITSDNTIMLMLWDEDSWTDVTTFVESDLRGNKRDGCLVERQFFCELSTRDLSF